MRYKCEKCGKVMEDVSFYTYRDGRKSELCKKCLTMHIDDYDESTFVWLLEKFDVPYIPEEWNILRDRTYEKNGGKKKGTSAVFGKYLAKMKLNQYKGARWVDSARIIAEREAKVSSEQIREIAFDSNLRKKYEDGVITEAEYRTMCPVVQQQQEDYEAAVNATAPISIDDNNPFDETQFLAENQIPDLSANLTDKDRIYLAMKWGRTYRSAEWIELEKMYNDMMNSFDIQDADSLNTLVLLCKTTLKANQAIDSGDIEGFQKLSKVQESLRKTAKFTAAQNKEEKEDYISSIGQLVSICEQQGFIPRYATDIPQDKVDQTLKDQKDYIYKLVTDDLGFGQQIEDALKKIEIQRQFEIEENKKIEALGEDYNPSDFEPTLDDDDIADFDEDIAAQRDLDERRRNLEVL